MRQEQNKKQNKDFKRLAVTFLLEIFIDKNALKMFFGFKILRHSVHIYVHIYEEFASK